MPESFVHTDEFDDALARLHHGENLFLTGKAGTGKSTLIRRFLASTQRNVVVVAPTGIAALNVGGYTIHRLFGFPSAMSPELVRGNGYYPGRFAATLKELHTLIVDEASMVRADLFDCLAVALQRFGPQPGEPFGGVQMVLVGDLYQLPPVVADGERAYFETTYTSPYFFAAHKFNRERFATVELTRVFRQVGDNRLVEILNAVREGSLLQEARQELNTRTDREFVPPLHEFWLTLTTTNRMATSRNRSMLEQLSEPEVSHFAQVTGDVDGFEKPTDDHLRFKVGAQIMMLTNDPWDRWVNGTIAKIVDQYRESGEQVVVVELPDGMQAEVHPHQWEVTRPTVHNGVLSHDLVGTYTQLPFRLAWAVTIHKSQGQTLDRVVVDLTGGTFADGQLYVALSRCTSMDGLVLRRDVLAKDLKVDQRVRRFLATERAESSQTLGNVYIGMCTVGDVGQRWRPRPAEIAVITDDGVELTTLVNPTRDMGQARHDFGITAGDVQLAPLLTEAWAALEPYLAGRTPVGPNIDRDLGWLDHELKRMGYVVTMPLGRDLHVDGADLEQRQRLYAPTALERARAIRDIARGAEPHHRSADTFSTPAGRPGYVLPRHPNSGAHGPVRFLVTPGDRGETAESALAAMLTQAAQRSRLDPTAQAVVQVVEEQTGITVLDSTYHDTPQHTIDSVLQPGTRVCFTGTAQDSEGRVLERYDMEILAVSAGLAPVANVTKTRCDVLISAEAGSQSRKAQNAAKFGKPVFTAVEFLAWVNGETANPATTTTQDPPAVVVEPLLPQL
ncbi:MULTISPECIES: AAA family ATPase [Kocuria]|uniref:AAA family ATPase n=1 Tax=Kocuria subflava TaxID=1736139 RepID=A0A846TQK9_9MICC|nr:AAA family ATPase [Kocuria sp. CPCC 104605]NKE10733.1 AAA family ATPase [Kocuria subflava]